MLSPRQELILGKVIDAYAASAPTLTIGTKTARASGKKLTLALNATGALTNVTVKLTRNGKTVATGKLARLDGAGTVVIKLKRKLAPGSYKVALIGTSAGGAVTSSGALKIRR